MIIDEESFEVLSELSYSLWKKKALYDRALELCEKTLVDASYVHFLNEVLKEVKGIDKKTSEEIKKEIEKELQK